MLVSNGTLVEVNNHKINVLVTGNENSELTLVFMSGAGTCCPALDFKTLYSEYESNYKIAVVEKAGYGFSDDSDISRDIDTVLDETRQALRSVGITENLLLFPHSMSGIEALYWANKYPDEIKGIVGLDPALPENYENMKISRFALGMASFGVRSGLVRLVPSVVNDSAAIKYGSLTEQEKDLYRALFYKMTLSHAMLNESKEIKNSAKKLKEIGAANTPMLIFVSNGEGTGYSKTDWQRFAINYAENKPNCRYVLLDCSHYVHNIEYELIYAESLEFIKSL
ncbi:MAG: alpha/beta hydrolase [Firmicutes bacterium]|nr:alpha/beta hydrolase [Bacillota bacterium]